MRSEYGQPIKKVMWKNLIKNRKTAAWICIIVLAAAICLGSLCITYLINLKKMVREESTDYLTEISDRVNENTQTIIEANFTELYLLGDIAVNPDYTTIDEVQKRMEAELRERTGVKFEAIIPIDSEGRWYVDGTFKTYPVMTNDLVKVILEQKAVMSTAHQIDGTDYIVFFVPTIKTGLKDTEIGALAGLISLSEMQEYLALNTFNQKGYAYIVNRDGSILVRPNAKYESIDGYNIISILNNTSSINDEDMVSKFAEDLKQGKRGQIRYTYEGVERLMNYAPMGSDDWYLLVVVPAGETTGRSDAFFRVSFLSCIALYSIFMLLFFVTIIIQLQNKMRLEKVAYVDEVTGGRNKHKFEIDAAKIFSQNQTNYSMIYVNVEKFKLLNDQIGKENADTVLKKIYEIIASGMFEDEFAARMMADHFAVLLQTQNVDEIVRRAKEWNREIDYELSHMEVPCKLVLTYGIYPIEDTQLHIALIVDSANLARKSIQAVSSEVLNYKVYDDSLKRKMRREQELENRMEQALEDNEFIMYLQPKYALETSQIAGMEALVRWQENEGMIYPDEFIPLFERNGFIVRMDLYIFREACRFLRHLLDEGRKPVCISVNLSRAHLDNPGFLGVYERIWKEYKIPASLIELEFTETMLYDCIGQLNEVITEIRRIGFRCSMDDFGSGYSSLNMLRNIDVDVIKLDKQFFGQQEAEEGKGLLIIKNIINLAKDLNMQVVAEGIEEEWQIDYLRRFGCDIVQGYYFARPMQKNEAEQLL